MSHLCRNQNTLEKCTFMEPYHVAITHDSKK
jgi:hypothetical protein